MTPTLTRRSCMGALASVVTTGAVSAEPVLLDTAALAVDADVLRRAYSELHPGLLRYQTSSEAQARFAALSRRLSRPTTLADAYVAFARTTAGVRCGHSFLNPANQEGAGAELILGGQNRLPFRFAWLGGRMIVLDGAALHPALRPGTEVVSISGVSCRTLLRELTPLVPADGHNDAKRVRSLDLRGEENWPLFDVLLPLVRPEITRGGVARLEVRGPRGEPTRTVEVALLSRAEREGTTRPGVVTRGSTEAAWRLERLPDRSGWLTMPSWAVFDSNWDWRSALDADLDQLAVDRAPGLVIDLRGNVGGLDVGDVILSRLVDRDTPKVEQRRLTRYRRTPADLNPFLKTWDRSFRDWGVTAVGPNAQGFYDLAPSDVSEGAIIQPRGKRFGGKVVVLVDASNSSATFGFAEVVKRRGLGTLVGETTGGNRRGVNGGAFFFLQLPGSGLEIDVPLIGYFPTHPQPDVGVEPDVHIALTADNVAAGVDRQRLAAHAQLTSA